MRFFFHHLYHSFAWAYDWVAATVSLGHWNEWVRASAGLLRAPAVGTTLPVLELGCGTGHLQEYLAVQGIASCALEESPQMIALARRRLAQAGHAPRLARGMAQRLPYPSAAFPLVVATFPAPYIFEAQTLAEVQRVLAPGGELVILLAAWLTGRSLPERAMRWLFRVTRETPPEDEALEEFLKPFADGGFQARLRFVEKPGARLMFILAKKGPISGRKP